MTFPPSQAPSIVSNHVHQVVTWSNPTPGTSKNANSGGPFGPASNHTDVATPAS